MKLKQRKLLLMPLIVYIRCRSTDIYISFDRNVPIKGNTNMNRKKKKAKENISYHHVHFKRAFRVQLQTTMGTNVGCMFMDVFMCS